MEFKQAMRIFSRICKEREMCDGCVLENRCIVLKECDYSTAEAILTKWAEEHPERTIADDFFEKHPNAPRDGANDPYPCAKDCGYSKPPYCERIPFRCNNCWRRPLEEVERF